MVSEEIYSELSMPYNELCAYLINKYGPAPCDYFPNPACRARRKEIGRGAEGLYCHHIDEDKGGNLQNPAQAQMQPFSWQKADRLVYCNILEHLLLHIKIAVMRQKRMLKQPSDIPYFFTTGGIFQICREFISLFAHKGGKGYLQKCYEAVESNLVDYAVIINSMLAYIDSIYLGEQLPSKLKKNGKIVFYPDEQCIVVEIDEAYKRVRLLGPDGKLAECDISILIVNNGLSYADVMEVYSRRLTSTFEGEFFRPIYDVLKAHAYDGVEALAKKLSVDFLGYGHPQFCRDYISRPLYEADSVDEYISRAFPAFMTPSYHIQEKKPVFWKGQLPKELELNKTFYIVRVQSAFTIKSGETPFVFDHKNYLDCDENNNLLTRRGKLIESTDDTIVLTFTKEDFELFQKRYTIKMISILDGCYFL